MTKAMRVGVALAGLAASFLPRPAQSCERPCLGATAAPADGASLPANVTSLPSFAGAPTLACGGTSASQVLELRDAAGEAVPSDVVAEPGSPTTLGWRWLVPRQPLVVGAQYRLVFSDPCASSSCTDGTPPALVEHGFTVIGAVSRPSSLATVAATEPQLGTVMVGTDSGACVAPVEAVSQKLAFVPSGEAVPLLPVTRWTVVVDGSVWSTTDYGGVAADGVVTARYGSTRSPDVLFSRCGDVGVSGDAGLSSGSHDVTILARVAGDSADHVVAQLTAELWCDCIGQPDGTSCDDLDACTTSDRCVGGICAGTPVCNAAGALGDGGTPLAERPAANGGCTSMTAGSSGSLLGFLLGCYAVLRPRRRAKRLDRTRRG